MSQNTISECLSDSGRHFFISPFTLPTLEEVIQAFTGSDNQVVAGKTFIRAYLPEYFNVVQPQTMLVEKNFEDDDFLKDYAQYYAYGFRNYDRRCLRIHLFKTEFTEEDFNAKLLNKPVSISDDWEKEYLGYMIIRPFPNRFLGRMLIKQYGDKPSRYFLNAQPQVVNLFGILLTVYSLPFQEQDGSVGACATSALWAAFNQTAMLFRHRLPSPFEITRAATAKNPLTNRSFPNKGLSSEQIAEAIRHVGLEPMLYEAKSDFLLLKAFIMAMLNAQIPSILGMCIYDCTVPDAPVQQGNHAVTVVGYNVSDFLHEQYHTQTDGTQRSVKLYSSRIDKIYVHDDQVGPYARMKFDGAPPLHTLTSTIHTLTTSWGAQVTTQPAVYRAQPYLMIAPSPYKLRISFKTILAAIISFDADLLQRSYEFTGVTTDIEWQLLLSTNEDIKQALFNEPAISDTVKLDQLCKPLPQYCWRAVARSAGGKPIIELIFDATDTEEGAILQTCFPYTSGEAFFEYIVNVCVRFQEANSLFLNRHVRNIVTWMSQIPQ